MKRDFETGLPTPASRNSIIKHGHQTRAQYRPNSLIPLRFCQIPCRFTYLCVKEPNLPIQFRGENAHALPADREGQSGRVLLRPRPDYPAATVADFSTAVLKHRAILTRMLRGGTAYFRGSSSEPGRDPPV